MIAAVTTFGARVHSPLRTGERVVVETEEEVVVETGEEVVVETGAVVTVIVHYVFDGFASE